MQEQVQEKDLNVDEKCIFCKIIKGEIPCAKIYEDDKILSFLDIAPANKGHALVMPKEHYETLVDVPADVSSELSKAVKKVARALSSALGNEGFNILVNNKKVAGQLVPHAHIHVIPRFSGDGISLNWSPRKYKDKELDEFKEKIKSFL